VIGKAVVFFQDADSDPYPDYLGKRMEWTKNEEVFDGPCSTVVLDIRRVIKNGSS
jgi:hypothetical protein